MDDLKSFLDGFGCDDSNELSDEELAALDALGLELHAGSDEPMSTELSAEVTEPSSLTYPETAAASVTRASATSDARELIRLLREEEREDSISPARLADIFDAVLSQAGGGSGLTDEEREEIESRVNEASNNASSACDRASEALEKAKEALSQAKTAVTSAGDAKSDSETANSTANSAMKAAEDAQSTATAAKKTVDNIVKDLERISKILSPLTDIWIGTDDELAALPEINDTVLYFVKEKTD